VFELVADQIIGKVVVTGGYFADPGYKDVPNPGRLGFPLAEIQDDGVFVVTMVPGSGGMVTLA
jgi:hypothetical protein